MHQFGLIKYAEIRSATTRTRCSVAEMKKLKAGKVVPLTIDDVMGAFTIIGVGVGLGTLSLISECLFAMVKKFYQSKESI